MLYVQETREQGHENSVFLTFLNHEGSCDPTQMHKTRQSHRCQHTDKDSFQNLEH